MQRRFFFRHFIELFQLFAPIALIIGRILFPESVVRILPAIRQVVMLLELCAEVGCSNFCTEQVQMISPILGMLRPIEHHAALLRLHVQI